MTSMHVGNERALTLTDWTPHFWTSLEHAPGKKRDTSEISSQRTREKPNTEPASSTSSSKTLRPERPEASSRSSWERAMRDAPAFRGERSSACDEMLHVLDAWLVATTVLRDIAEADSALRSHAALIRSRHDHEESHGSLALRSGRGRVLVAVLLFEALVLRTSFQVETNRSRLARLLAAKTPSRSALLALDASSSIRAATPISGPTRIWVSYGRVHGWPEFYEGMFVRRTTVGVRARALSLCAHIAFRVPAVPRRPHPDPQSRHCSVQASPRQFEKSRQRLRQEACLKRQVCLQAEPPRVDRVMHR